MIWSQYLPEVTILDKINTRRLTSVIWVSLNYKHISYSILIYVLLMHSIVFLTWSSIVLLYLYYYSSALLGWYKLCMKSGDMVLCRAHWYICYWKDMYDPCVWTKGMWQMIFGELHEFWPRPSWTTMSCFSWLPLLLFGLHLQFTELSQIFVLGLALKYIDVTS